MSSTNYTVTLSLKHFTIVLVQNDIRESCKQFQLKLEYCSVFYLALSFHNVNCIQILLAAVYLTILSHLGRNMVDNNKESDISLQIIKKNICNKDGTVANFVNNVPYQSKQVKNNHVIRKFVMNGEMDSKEGVKKLLKREDSFSSLSSDSTAYSGSMHSIAQNNSKMDISNNNICFESKRHRNSSGSSTVSSISDSSSKEIVPSKVNGIRNCLQNIHVNCSSENFSKNVIVSNLVNKQLSSVSDTLTTSSEVSTIVKEQSVSFTCNTVEEVTPIIERRHNLRRHIRKKACCNCDCSSSCTTVTVRRYTEITQQTTTTRKRRPNSLVVRITPTRVKRENSIPKLSPIKAIVEHEDILSSPPKIRPNRKRRTEVDKLYDALHEIKWAEHMSPDNILCPLDLRRTSSPQHSASPNKKPSKCSTVLPKSPCRTLQSNNPSFKQLKFSPRKLRSSRNLKNENANKLSSANESTVDIRESLNVLQEPSEVLDFEDCSYIKSVINKYKNDDKYLRIPRENYGASLVQEPSISNAEESQVKDDVSKTSNDSNLSLIMKEFDNEVANILKASVEKVSSQFDEVNNNELGNKLTEIENSGSNIYWGVTNIEEGSLTVFSKPIPAVDLFDSSNLRTGSIHPENILTLMIKDDSEVSGDHPEVVNHSGDNLEVLDVCAHEEIVTTEEPVAIEDSNINNDRSGLPSLIKISPMSEHCPELQEMPPVLQSYVGEFAQYDVVDLTEEIDRGSCQSRDSEKIQGSLNNEEELEDNRVEHSISREYPKTTNSYSKNSYNYLRSRKILKKYRERPKRHLKVNKPQRKVTTVEESFCVMEKTSTCFDSTETSTNVISLEHKEHKSKHLCNGEQVTLRLTLMKQHNGSSEQFEEMEISTEEIMTTEETRETSPSRPTLLQSPAFRMECLEALELRTLRNRRNVRDEHVAKVHFTGNRSRKQLAAIEENKHPNVSQALMHMDFSCVFHYKGIVVNKNETYTQVTLKIVREHRIYLSVETLYELKNTLCGANSDASCKVLILNGVGDSFCSGLDLKPLLGSKKASVSKEMAVAVKDFVEALAGFQKPLVTVLNGAAVGLGVTILAYSDIVIASDQATLHMPYNQLGYSPEGAATLMLPHCIRSTVAMDMLLRGRMVTATHACDLGLVSEVLPASQLPHELVSRVRVLAENNSTSLESIKAMLRLHLNARLSMTLESETVMLPEQWLSEPCQRALQNAFDCGLLA